MLPGQPAPMVRCTVLWHTLALIAGSPKKGREALASGQDDAQ
jgi:hypothetical protein